MDYVRLGNALEAVGRDLAWLDTRVPFQLDPRLTEAQKRFIMALIESERLAAAFPEAEEQLRTIRLFFPDAYLLAVRDIPPSE